MSAHENNSSGGSPPASTPPPRPADVDEEKIALKGFHEAHAAEEHEEHEEHLDERWLVSYADMMTLLFGLFVMLYAMQDPEQVKKMQQSIEQRFATNQEEPENPQEATPTPQPVSFEEYNKVRTEKTFTEDNLRIAQVRLTELEEQTKQTAKIIQENKDLTAKALENESLKRKIASVETEISKKPVDDTQSLKRKIAEAEKKTTRLEKEVTERDQKITDLNQKLKALQGEKKDFLAIVISWSTQDHDIDLSVKDPTGKVFNFKNRKFANHPGAFLLDTRRGPGTEAWQSDQLLPGIYEIRVEFYNQYGNANPAVVRGTIFSGKGTFEIKEEQMGFASSKVRITKVEVSKNGDVRIVP